MFSVKMKWGINNYHNEPHVFVVQDKKRGFG
jgi:hypothetical protein